MYWRENEKYVDHESSINPQLNKKFSEVLLSHQQLWSKTVKFFWHDQCFVHPTFSTFGFWYFGHFKWRILSRTSTEQSGKNEKKNQKVIVRPCLMSKKYTLLIFKGIWMNFLLELKFFVLSHLLASKQPRKIVQIHMHHPVYIHFLWGKKTWGSLFDQRSEL